MNEYMPEWLRSFLGPIQPSGPGSINRGEAGQLQQLEEPEPDERARALDVLAEDGGMPPKPEVPPGTLTPERQKEIEARLRIKQQMLDEAGR